MFIQSIGFWGLLTTMFFQSIGPQEFNSMFIQSIGVLGFTGSKVPGCRSWVSGFGYGDWG